MTLINIASLLVIPIGFYVLIWSADRFVEGASALAKNFGVPPLIIGLTIVGFATSAPEMLISALAAVDHQGGLAIGNALGSNITNIALVLGLSALLYPFTASPDSIKKDFPVLIICLLVMGYLLYDKILSTTDGFVLLTGLLIIFASIIWRGLRQPKSASTQELMEDIPDSMPTAHAFFWLLTGLTLLLASSKGLVWGSVNIAQLMGVSDLIIGLTIVALGTSLPELAATMASIKKQEADLALGNIIGSNIFNTLGVVGIAGAINTISVDNDVLYRDIPITLGITVLLLILGVSGGLKKIALNRLSGSILLATYITYMVYLGISSLS